MKEIKLKLTLREKMTDEEMEKLCWGIIQNSNGKVCIVDKLKETSAKV